MTAATPKWWVESADPSYGPAAPEEMEPGDPGAAGAGPEGAGPSGTGSTGPTQRSDAVLDTDVEVPTGAWRAVPYPAELRPPSTVLLVDGVRRIDARVWTAEPDGDSHPGVAASYAAGVVRCDLHAGAAVLASVRVQRGLFTTSPTAVDLDCGAAHYPVHRVGGGAVDTAADPPDLSQAVQRPLSALESELAAAVRDGGGAADDAGDTAAGDDLLVVDGPLQYGTHLPRAVGYVKTHRRRYLPPPLSSVVTGLTAGARSPVFRLGTSWTRYTWYLRLPGGSGAPWSGLVRLECSPELTPTAAVRLADLSAVTVPRFASASYKDPRAPHNLVPIGGLERRLRSRLGDVTLLQRALTRAARAG